MFSTVRRVPKDEMKAGDLVFFRHGRGVIYHVGIYLKGGKFAHAACNGGVMVSSLHEAYHQRNFYAAGRVAGTEALLARRYPRRSGRAAQAQRQRPAGVSAPGCL
ncbi:MAG: NlpC/P60 family protein [Hymenobacter sp.]